jgi:sulfide:quinone oxidoreductase
VAELAQSAGAELVSDHVAAVAPERHALRLRDGATLEYGVLVAGVGARSRTAFPRAITFSGLERSTVYNGLLADLDERWTNSVAFVVPPGVTWPLPLYELALQTAGQARSMGVDDAHFALYTPEPAPLAVFGEASSAVVGRLLEEHGVDFHGGVELTADAAGHLQRDGRRLSEQRVVALPTLEGPVIPGLPGDPNGFLDIDDFGRVAGVDDMYAAGDGTSVAVKQGGVATQLADVIAAHIAARAGADVEVKPFAPELHARLLVGGAGVQPLPPDGDGPALEPLDAAMKVQGRYLSSWLQARA